MAQKLPPEILQLIAKCLAPFDYDQHSIDHQLFHSRPTFFHGTLASLCLVCRAFCDFATPVLYSIPMTPKVAELTRTLLDRPDLAQHVRSLHHKSWNGVDRAAVGPKFKELEDKAYDYIEGRVAEDENGPLARGTDWHNPVADLRRDRQDERNDNVIDSMIVSLCPNLTKLHISSYYRPVLPSLPPNSLLNLTTVTASHGDTEGGLDFCQLYYLAQAAPNISTLVIQALSQMGNDDGDEDDPAFSFFPSFPHVTTLKLERTLIDESAFAAFLRSFPRLEDFAYECGDATISDTEGIRARPLLDAILAHAPALKALDVGMGNCFEWDTEEEDEHAWDERLAQLGERGLETLAVDVCTLQVGWRCTWCGGRDIMITEAVGCDVTL